MNDTENIASDVEIHILIESLKEHPGDTLKRKKLFKLISTLDADERDVYVEKLFEALKSIGIKKKTIENSINEERKKAAEDVKAKTGNSRTESPSCPYFTSNNKLYMEKQTKEGPVSEALASFTATIEQEETRDDGIETNTSFIINGKLDSGEPLPKAAVPASKFATMNWVVEHWGTRTVVYAGFGKKDHTRAAIQLLSENVCRKTVFTHTGWRQHKDAYIYIHAGGAIGKDGPVNNIHTEQETALDDVHLPDPPEDQELLQAVEALFRFLDVAPGHITYPLLSGAFRAALNHIQPADFSLFLSGFTGTMKTALAEVVQGFWGAGFMENGLPGNWSSTANALEKLVFLAKDMIVVVDDFCPTGSGNDIARLHRDADRVLRGQGNQAGRNRMSPDGSLRPAYKPRGIPLSTGEDIPRGQSLRGRIFTLELQPGYVDLKKLSSLQDAARQGVLAQGMAAFIKSTAEELDKLKDRFREQFIQLRENAREKGIHNDGHDRTPEIFANLMIGFKAFIGFALKAGVISKEDAQVMVKEAEEQITVTARAQAALLQDEDPLSRFVSLLSAAINNGQAFVARAEDGNEPYDGEHWGWRDGEPQGAKIGWVGEAELYLEPETAYSVTQRMAASQGTSLVVGQNTLWKRMKERGLIMQYMEGRNTIKKIVQGRRKNVICLSSYTFEKVGQPGQAGQ